MAVIGVSKSGKSTLAKELAEQLDLVRVKVSGLVRRAVVD